MHFSILDVVLTPLILVVRYPWVGLLPAAAFLGYFLARRGTAARLGEAARVRWSLFSGLAWLAYMFYELRMQAWAKTVAGAPIRVDLLLVGTVLLMLSVPAVWCAVAFESTARRGPVRGPVRPMPEDRRVLAALALALAVLSMADFLVPGLLMGRFFGRGDAVILVLDLALAFFLVRGASWARGLAVARCALGAAFKLFAWSSLAPAGPLFEDLRRWSLVGAVAFGALGVALLWSRRVRRFA